MILIYKSFLSTYDKKTKDKFTKDKFTKDKYSKEFLITNEGIYKR